MLGLMQEQLRSVVGWTTRSHCVLAMVSQDDHRDKNEKDEPGSQFALEARLPDLDSTRIE